VAGHGGQQGVAVLADLGVPSFGKGYGFSALGGDLLVQGEVDALTYEEEVPSSFLSRLFRG